MPKPKVIPQEREQEILARAGAGETAEQIAVWLSGPDVLDRRVDGRRVREFLEAQRKGRAPITQAIIEKHVAETVTSDLDAVDDLLKDERDLQKRIGRMDALLDDLERVAKSDMAEMVDSKGRFLPLQAGVMDASGKELRMPESARRALAGVKIRQEFSGAGEDRYHSGDIIEVDLWDKPAAIAAIGRIRAQAVAQQQRLLELRLKLAGAGEKEGDSVFDIVLAAQRRRKEKAAAEAAVKASQTP